MQLLQIGENPHRACCMAYNPLYFRVVSVASDRVRTRFGRRSPFMYVGVPGVAVTLIVMGILTWAAPALVRSITGLLTPGQLIVAVMAFLMIWFQVFSNLGLSIS